MKCNLCGKELDPLCYFQLKIDQVTKMKILDGHVKHKDTVTDCKLCGPCQEEIRAAVIQRILAGGQEVKDNCAAFQESEETEENLQPCDGNCIDCPKR